MQGQLKPAGTKNANGGDRYEHPSPQIVFVKSKSPVINISLPHLQQYYTNMQMKNQDYAYFQVVYYDFPAATSMFHAFAGVPSVKFTLLLNYKLRRTSDGAIIHQGVNIDDLTLDLTGVMNCEQIADRVRAQLMMYQLRKIGTDPAAASTALILLKQVVDFIFDPATQKFAFILKPLMEAPELYTPGRILQMTISMRDSKSQYLTPQQCKIMAGVFGGITTAAPMGFATDPTSYPTGDEPLTNPKGWVSIYTSGPLNIQDDTDYLLDALMEKLTHPTDPWYKYAFTSLTTITLYPSRTSNIQVNNYLYIRGCPEASIWNTDGTSTDYSAILPLNRPYGTSAIGESNYLTTKTHVVKTTLNSLRMMKFTLTDEDGNPMYFQEDYVLKLAVLFDID